MTRIEDRPLIEIAEEADRAEAERAREREVRNQLIRQRIQQSQTAAEVVGLRRGQNPWKLIGLIAKIAGWEALQTTRYDLYTDREIQCTESGLKACLAKLEAAGLITRQTLKSVTYRGREEEVGIQLQLNGTRIRELAEAAKSGSNARVRMSFAMPLEREREEGVTDGVTDPVTDPVTEGVTEGVTNPVTDPVTLGNHSICLSHLPNSLIPKIPPSPLEVRLGNHIRSDENQEEEVLNSLIEKFKDRGVYTADDDLPPLARVVGVAYLEKLLAFYEGQRSSFGPGALCVRLRRSRPLLAVDEGWPKRKAPAMRSLTELIQ